MEMIAPKGSDSWLKTHHHICFYMGRLFAKPMGRMDDFPMGEQFANGGHKALRELSTRLTNDFENDTITMDWEDEEYYVYSVVEFAKNYLTTRIEKGGDNG